MTTKKIALFIDADNISAKFGKQIIETLEARGEIFIRRIYGNWEKFSLHGWNECILNCSLRAVQQPDFATGKNATDMSLTIDAMDVLHDGKAEVFALVSNDSDFTPLAIRLREGGVTVLGLGTAQVSNSFRSACSEFIDLAPPAESKKSAPVEEIPAQAADKVQAAKPSKVTKKSASVQLSLFDDNAPPVEKPQSVVASPKVIPIPTAKLQSERDKKLRQLHDILRESARTHGDDAGFSLLNHAGQAIKSKHLGFGVKDFGYSHLRDFIAAFPKLYETRQDATGKNFCYRCIEPKAPAADKLRQVHNILRETASAQGDQKGFVDLTCAGQNIRSKKISIKGLGHSTLSKFVAAFPKLYEVQKAGKLVRYRCR